MTDEQVFIRFMGIMGLTSQSQIELPDGSLAIIFSDKETAFDKSIEYQRIEDGYTMNDLRFTSTGYEHFDAGAIFDKHGTLIKGFMDSHVICRSPNHDLILGML